jgi:hypothetical protein
MSPVVLIIGVVLALSVILVLWLIWRAPEGRQDREGFHGESGGRSEANAAGSGTGAEGGGPEVRKVG